ncbi:ABC transporter substrate-binding protein [Mucisphaera calidilacus]|uniref:ABC transporter substrate binding protein n=1 Tax=Mucisphaera calidilacus TaxID=2527982 RepID=A0A518BUE6_9BACT|nr:ABC transporter substrate binding protein [Mucisphaera calidilacus]QDU70586.1 ABC transporter substrate binding protein [Mucisphaera calidilacus]
MFCGVNAEASKYGFPADNVTGILERPHLGQAINMFRKINPGARSIAILGDDSPTMDATIAYCKTQKTPLPVTAFDQPSDFDAWKATVASYKGKVDAIVMQNYHTVKRSAGGEENMEPADVMRWTTENAGIPVIGLMTFNLELGSLCGIAEYGSEHGFMAASIAREMIQKGKTARDYPITKAKEGIVMLNLRQAEYLRIRVPYALIKTAKLIVKPERQASAR